MARLDIGLPFFAYFGRTNQPNPTTRDDYGVFGRPGPLCQVGRAKGSRKAASSKDASIIGCSDGGQIPDSTCAILRTLRFDRGRANPQTSRLRLRSARPDSTKLETRKPAAPAPDESMAKQGAAPASFEAALAELEEIVAKMEGGALPLAESLAAYKRGAELLLFCQTALKDAEQQIQVFEKGVLKAFESTEAEAARSDES
ncbi:MAG: exodeoxyribonuclease VII small subunit [Betaproteobacteria bacterium]